jgi:hypothetical protein
VESGCDGQAAAFRSRVPAGNRHALYFGIVWSSLMQIIHLVSPTIRAPGLIASIFAGILFGSGMALIYALRKRRLQLADWQTVIQQPD